MLKSVQLLNNCSRYPRTINSIQAVAKRNFASKVSIIDVMILISDLCNFLYDNTKSLNTHFDIIESFYNLNDYHIQNLLELQKMGLITLKTNNKYILLNITYFTINQICESLKLNPVFKDLLNWKDQLNCVFLR